MKTVRRLLLPVRQAGTAPTREQLLTRAARLVAAAALVVLAAGVVHQGGWDEHQWQYVAIAASLLPEALRDALAAADAKRRARLRAHRGLSPVPLLMMVALLALAAWALTGGTVTPVVAALVAAAGMAVAAAPLRVTMARAKSQP